MWPNAAAGSSSWRQQRQPEYGSPAAAFVAWSAVGKRPVRQLGTAAAQQLMPLICAALAPLMLASAPPMPQLCAYTLQADKHYVYAEAEA
jgi:hypothetical protein